MPTILELIGESQKQKTLANNLNYTEQDPYKGYSSYTSDRNRFSDVGGVSPATHITKRLTQIGQERLADTIDFNLFKPQTFELQQIEVLPIGNLDSSDIETYAKAKYESDVLLNHYKNQQREIVTVDNPVPLDPKYGDYADGINDLMRISDNKSVLSVFLGNTNGNDSRIGKIGDSSLKGAMETNFKENLKQMTLGRINSRLFDILQQQSLFRRDYSITVNPNPVARTIEVLQRLEGVQYPFSTNPPDMFDIENNEPKSGQDRNSLIFSHTGKGNRIIIKHNLERNLYRPFISDGTIEVAPNYYVFYDGTDTSSIDYAEFNAQYFGVNSLSALGDQPGEPVLYDYYGIGYNKKNPNVGSEYISGYFGGISDETTSDFLPVDWSSETLNRFSKKSMLYKTKQIVLEQGDSVFIDSFKKEFLLKKNGESSLIPRGASVTSKGGFTMDDSKSTPIAQNEYFRVFTKGFKYNEIARAIRHRTLDSGEKRTVLEKNGKVRIMPTNTDEGLIKRTFFSIENLAWKNRLADLPPCERGTPDVNLNAGRFMSFPPYDLKFSESVNVEFKEYSFIGRGEKVYAYNNTTRSGTLSFMMVVDHPDMVNKRKGEASQLWERYFWGDMSVKAEIDSLVSNRLTPDEKKQLSSVRNREIPIQKQVQGNVITQAEKTKRDTENKLNEKEWFDSQPNFVSIYFPNETSVIPDAPGGNVQNNAGYEFASETLSPSDPLFYTYIGGKRKDTKPDTYENQYNYGLNSEFFTEFDSKLKQKVKDLFESGTKEATIYIYGYASKAVTSVISNEKIALNRANSTKVFIEKKMNELGLLTYGVKFKYETKSFSDTLDVLTNENTREDDLNAKTARRSEIKIISDESQKPEPPNDPNDLNTIDDVATDGTYAQDPDQNNAAPAKLSNELYEKLFYSECDWFEEIEITDPIRYNSISETIRYFSPLYHSTSPSSFNRRLNFLHQCTRQGTSESFDETKPNLAFGTQPLLKIMIGDFFYTYALCRSMTIDYDTSNGIMWDMNPEGIGVQPLMCKVSMEISILGSQSLSSPINRLNNALSFNFYANTSAYDARANDVVFSAKGTDGEVEAKIVEGVKYSEALANYSNAPDATDRESEVMFRNIPPDAPPTSDGYIDDVNLEIDQLRGSLGLKKQEIA